MKTDTRPDWSGKTIVVVEDDVNSYLYLKAILFSTGARILYAKNGKEALELCKKTAEIDIILMDIILPEMNGYAAAKLINQFKSVPIIAQSAIVPDLCNDRFSMSEFSDFILKPFKPSQILNAIQNQLSGPFQPMSINNDCQK